MVKFILVIIDCKMARNVVTLVPLIELMYKFALLRQLSLIYIYNSIMLGNSKWNDKILVIGDCDRLKLGGQGNMREVNFSITSQQSKSFKNKQSVIKPLKVYSQGLTIAVVDQNSQGWLICQSFDNPINLSNLIRSKITNIFLGEKQLIVKTKKNFVLINWGSKKMLDCNSLIRINTFGSSQYDSLFEAFTVNNTNLSDLYYYNYEKKLDNGNRLFELHSQEGQIIGYPLLNTITIDKKIKGLSVGKYHSLLWTCDGQLYSWGCKTLALGYGQLPQENLISTPTLVCISKYVLSAFAATHYSLALAADGAIYEWGIKMQINQINEEPIFHPRPLQFQYFDCQARFISLKGRDNNFAALSSTGQLYVWGHNARILLNSKILLPSTWKGNYIYEPVLQTDLLDHKILDFSIEIGFICVVIGTDDYRAESDQQYWSLLKIKAKKNISNFKMLRTNTETSIHVKQIKEKFKNSILTANLSDRNSMITNCNRAANNHLTCKTKQPNSKSVSKVPKLGDFKMTAPPFQIVRSPSWLHPISKLHKRQASEVYQSSMLLLKEKFSQRSSQFQSNINQIELPKKAKNPVIKKQFSSNYNLKLQQILQKKKKIELTTIEMNLKKIDQYSIEFKQKKKSQYILKQLKMEQQAVIKQSLASYLTKNYIIKLLTAPLDYGRDIKIENFSRTLVLDRVQKNIKRMFTNHKIKFTIDRIKKNRFQLFLKLYVYVNRYIVNFRKRKHIKSRTKVVLEITKLFLKQKISTAMGNLHFKVNKLKKMNDWLCMYNTQRKNILSQLWNNFILTDFRVKDGGQFYFVNMNHDPDLTFRQLYFKRREENCKLSLQTYMKTFTRKVRRAKTRCEKRQLTEFKKKGHIKFADQNKQKSNCMQILPYSLHHNYFKKPKNIDINISDVFKLSPFWIEIQRQTLNEFLRKTINQYDKEYITKKRAYEIDLANFIKYHYDTFYEKRWKYIIEYNKVEKTRIKKKKQEQLKRLMSLIGMRKLVEEDCIPEKHLVLQQALKRRDAPKCPDLIIHFDHSSFQEKFKAYSECVNARVKQVRKKIL